MHNRDTLTAIALIVAAHILKRDVPTEDIPAFIETVAQGLDHALTPRVSDSAAYRPFTHDPALM